MIKNILKGVLNISSDEIISNSNAILQMNILENDKISLDLRKIKF